MRQAVRFRADTAHWDHPLLAERKRLAARILIARNLCVYASSLGIADKPLVSDLLAVAETAANSGLARADGTSLSAFLEHVVDQLRIAHAANEKAFADKSESLDKIRKVLHRFSAEVQAFACGECARHRKDPRICHGGAVDDEILAEGALCLNFITDLFASLVNLAEKYYSPILPSDQCVELLIRLQTRVTPRLELGGKIEFPNEDSAGKRQSLITIDLPVWTFDSTHLSWLPYVMFHEIFVHAAESWLTNGKREDTNERCSFREGFVDAAALYALTQGLADGELTETMHEEFIDDFALGAESAHSARVTRPPKAARGADPEEHNKSEVVEKRATGWKVFKRFRDRHMAEEAVRLALCLNVLALSHDERTMLMQALDRSSDPAFFISRERGTWMEALLRAAYAHDALQVEALIARTIDQCDF